MESVQPSESAHGDGTALAVAHVLQASERVLITMHHAPDGDALGSALGLQRALQDAGKQAVVLCADPVPPALRFVAGAAGVVTALHPSDRFDATVACDTSHPSRLPQALPPPERRGIFVNLDHHPTTPRFGDLNLLDPAAAAVGVLVFRVLTLAGLRVGPEAASALYVSLLADTGSFRYGSTNPEALRVAAALVEAGARPGELASAIWERNTVARLKLLERVLGTLEVVHGGQVALMTVTSEAVSFAGTIEEPAEGLVSYPRSIEGVEVAVLLREESRQWRVSLRSSGRVNVAQIASGFGGGGHAAAAGFSRVGTQAEVRARVLAAVEGALGP